jgi:hypothetical protein
MKVEGGCCMSKIVFTNNAVLATLLSFMDLIFPSVQSPSTFSPVFAKGWIRFLKRTLLPERCIKASAPKDSSANLSMSPNKVSVHKVTQALRTMLRIPIDFVFSLSFSSN